MWQLRSTLTTSQRLWIVQKTLLLLERAPVLSETHVRFVAQESAPFLYEVLAMRGDTSVAMITLLEKPQPAPGWGAAPNVFELDAFSAERGNLFNPEDRAVFSTKDEGRLAVGLILHEILRIRGEA